MRRTQAKLRSLVHTEEDPSFSSLLSVHRFSMMNLHTAGAAVTSAMSPMLGMHRPPMRRSASASDAVAVAEGRSRRPSLPAVAESSPEGEDDHKE